MAFSLVLLCFIHIFRVPDKDGYYRPMTNFFLFSDFFVFRTF
jgi:hypothetical protein